MPSTVQALTEQFVAAIEGVVRTAIRDQVMASASLAGGGVTHEVVAAADSTSGPAKAKPAKAAAAKRAPVAKRAKAVTGNDLNKDGAALWAFIQGNPGARAEKIPAFAAKSALLKAMVESGHLRRSGAARGTQYFATKKVMKA